MTVSWNTGCRIAARCASREGEAVNGEILICLSGMLSPVGKSYEADRTKDVLSFYPEMIIMALPRIYSRSGSM